MCWKHCTLCCVMAGWRCRRPEPTTYDGDVAKGFLLFYYYYFSFCVDFCTGKSHQSDLSNSKRRRYLFTYSSFFRLSRLTHKQARRIVFARCLSSPAIIHTSHSSCYYNKTPLSKIILILASTSSRTDDIGART